MTIHEVLLEGAQMHGHVPKYFFPSLYTSITLYVCGVFLALRIPFESDNSLKKKDYFHIPE